MTFSLGASAASHGGTLRVSVNRAPGKLNPLLHRLNSEYLLGELLYSGLTRLGTGMEIVPDLAESWTANDALTEWTFKLRAGARFHVMANDRPPFSDIRLRRALGAEPDVIVCDEITSGLDASVQAAVVNLLREIQAATGVSLLFITHDLNLLRHADKRTADACGAHAVEVTVDPATGPGGRADG